MRILIQRVGRASVSVGGRVHSQIGAGLLIFVGIGRGDTHDDIEWLVKKAVQLRIFDDESGVMNLDVRQTGGEILVVSQFTLQASTKKGNRPSYITAAGEETAVPLYGHFLEELATVLGRAVASGVFGAHMDIELVNDGPVTIWMDSKDRR